MACHSALRTRPRRLVHPENASRFRLDIYGEDGPTFIDGGRQKRDTITGVVSFAASPGTVISADFMHQDYNLDGQQIIFTPYVNKQGQTWCPRRLIRASRCGKAGPIRDRKRIWSAFAHSQLDRYFHLARAYRHAACGHYAQSRRVYRNSGDL